MFTDNDLEDAMSKNWKITKFATGLTIGLLFWAVVIWSLLR